MEKKNYIAVFDIDDTILRVNSTKIVALAAYKKGLMRTRDLLSGVLQIYLYKYKLRDSLKIIDTLGDWTSGIKVDTITNLVDSIFEKRIIKTIRDEIVEEVKFHKSRNAETVILSSAISQICDPIAKHLGIDRVLCSEIEVVDGKFTGKAKGKFCFGKEKLNRLDEFCSVNKYIIEESWYYADSIDDTHVLEKVGHPVCVTPDKKLQKVAKKRNWPVYNWA